MYTKKDAWRISVKYSLEREGYRVTAHDDPDNDDFLWFEGVRDDETLRLLAPNLFGAGLTKKNDPKDILALLIEGVLCGMEDPLCKYGLVLPDDGFAKYGWECLPETARVALGIAVYYLTPEGLKKEGHLWCA